MKSSLIPSLPTRPGSAKIGLTILSLVLSGGFAIAQPTPGKTKSSATAPGKTPEKAPAASPKSTASPTPLPTRETKIDAKTEAELLQAEDRFVMALQNRDAKALEELLHPYFADSIEGHERAITKLGTITRASTGGLPIYRVERERKLIRSGDLFTVEGLATNTAREGLEDRRVEWVHVRRLWERKGDRWIATAQIITEKPDREEQEKELK
jgi:hypothetical protein